MTPQAVWKALAICGQCGGAVELLDEPAHFHAPMPLGKWDGNGKPPRFDGHRFIVGALYFRDPFHNPGKPFVNYCSSACSLDAGRRDAASEDR